MKCPNFLFSVQFLLRLFLLFGFFTRFSISSCCCDCCCGCCCCGCECGCGCCCGCGGSCCCGGGGGGCSGNNQLASLLGSSSGLSIGAQSQPPIVQQTSSVLGPDLLPDGSTGKAYQQTE